MKLKLTAAIALSLSGSVFAGPIYSTSCDVARDIVVPENSSGYFMDKTCKKAYVLPPSTGSMAVSGRTVGDISRCKEIKQFNKMLKTINSNINDAVKAKKSAEDIKGLFDQRKMIVDEFGDLEGVMGASVELLFSNGIDSNLASFRELNQNVPVEFVPVQLKNLQLNYNQTTPFDSQMQVAFNQTIPLSDLNNVGPGSFSGRLDLSLFGACPLIDPFERTIPEKIKAQDLSGIITPNMIYKYDIGATYKYTATYNLSGLASKIKSMSSSGGLFSTSSTSKLIETAESSGWFNLEMSCDDSRVCDQAKMETALTIKQRLVQEVLDQIAITKIGYSVRPADAAEPGKNGASTASDALKKCPNTYCQAAAVVLDVASSIFGGSSKTDQYIAKNDHKVTESVTENRPIEFMGMMGFGKRK